MTWPNQVEQWRQFAVWEGRDIPADLLLAIIAHESGGQAGLPANRPCKPGELPKMDGSTITVNRALGLTQCIPSVVIDYNAQNPEKAFYEDMTGTDERAARLQIRLGARVFAANVRQLHNYDPILFAAESPGRAAPNQLQLALIAYAIGFGAQSGPGGPGLKPKLDELKARGLPLNVESLARVFPTWGKSPESDVWINRPIQYAQTVWNNFYKYGTGQAGTDAPKNPLGLPDFPTLQKAAKKIEENWPWLLVAAALALMWTKTKKEQALPVSVGKAQVIARS